MEGDYWKHSVETVEVGLDGSSPCELVVDSKGTVVAIDGKGVMVDCSVIMFTTTTLMINFHIS